MQTLDCTLNMLHSLYGHCLVVCCTAHASAYARTSICLQCCEFDIVCWSVPQGMQDTAHVQQQACTCNAAQPKSMVERPSSSIMSDAIGAVYGRQEVMEALPVEAFQCQLWEPAKSVLALDPGMPLTVR